MKGIVYEIYIDSHPDIRYVGSTIQKLERRWQKHNSDFNTEKKGSPIICKYFKKFGIDNFQIRVIKEYEVVDGKHLLAYEQLWINKLKPINVIKNLFSTKKIRQMKKKEYNEEYNKEYYENNREAMKEKNRLYRENNRDAIRLYRENNRDSLNKKIKLYQENNRDAISEKRQIKYICPCEPDKELLKTNKAKHERTKKHQKYLQSLEETKE